MAGKSDVLNRLATLLGPLSEEDLVALGNRGLLRRARKDLSRGDLAGQVEATDAGANLTVAGYEIHIPLAGPALARCSCRSSGVCQHIIAAVLHLQGELDASGGSAKKELLGLSEGGLKKWARARTYREGQLLLLDLPDHTVQGDQAVTVRFAATGVSCRFLPGAGLEGAICSAPQGEQDRYVVAAVLALWNRAGRVSSPAKEGVATLDEPPGAPRSRRAVLGSAAELLLETVRVGLTHLSPAHAERLVTLALSARGTHLPRLSAELRRLADDVELLLQRSSMADTDQLLRDLARSYALIQACLSAGEAIPPKLVGRYRARYRPSGTHHLHGMGAWPWRAKSGYLGITALFWDEQRDLWFTYSDSRPESVALSFDPEARYGQPAPWGTDKTLRDLSHGRFSLHEARASDTGRLSGSDRSVVRFQGPGQPAELDLGERGFDDWARLREYAASVYPVGLQRYDPLAATVMLKPHAWGPWEFDDIDQRFSWALHDGAGAALCAELEWSNTTEQAIRTLENIDQDKHGLHSMVAQIGFSDRGLIVRPLSLLAAGEDGSTQVYSVRFGEMYVQPSAPANTSRARSANPRTPSMLQERDYEDLNDPSPFLVSTLSTSSGRLLVALEEILLESAERGYGGPIQESRLGELASELAECGFVLLAEGAKEAGAQPGQDQLLRLSYLCSLLRQLAARKAMGLELPASRQEMTGA